MSCKFNIGKMRHSVVFESATLAPNDSGGNTPTWSTFKSTRAEVMPAKAHQKWHAEKLGHRITHVLKMRYFAGITSDMRVLFDGRILQVHGVKDPDERKRFLKITLMEGVPS